MGLIAQSLVLCFLNALLGGAEPTCDDAGTYLSPGDPPKMLKEPLVLREEQGGIAGITGTIRTIQPDGKWQLEEFRRSGGKEQTTPTTSGRLSSAELIALANDLAANDLVGLPDKVGAEEPVNPHVVILQFGKKRTSLSGVSPRIDGDETTKSLILKSATDRGLTSDKQWKRFAELVHAVESRVAPPKS